MRVVFTQAAEDDFEAIGDWISQESNERAISFVGELRAACEAIGILPRAYSVVSPGARRVIRRKPYRTYLIFYWIKHSRVEILHVIHAARDYRKILFP